MTSSRSPVLNASRRATELSALADGAPLDVVVIGGGITGAGIALDGASRGLSVALVEKHDLAFGTSRWSSKLVHGGLRYLASGNVGIARRSAVERGILMTRNAPHLVSAMPQLVPLLPEMGGPARAVVNAAGVWAADVDETLRLRPSRGTHLVFDAAAFGHPTAALTIPIPGALNRFVFAMPEQLGRVYLGLTDEDAPGPIPDVPQPSPQEVTFLLDTVNTALATTLTEADVRGAYAGLRPLIDTAHARSEKDTGAGSTADLSRDHAVTESPSGVISVIGGKLTEYRYMAEDVLDRAIALRGLTAGPCRTRDLPLVGAVGRVPADLPSSLVARYGAEAPHVVARARCDRPTAAVADGIDVTRAEFEYAVTHEGALTADDILDRRTRIGLVEDDRNRALNVAKEFVDTLVE